MPWKNLASMFLLKSLLTPARPARTQLAMPSMRFALAAINAFWREATMPCPNSCSLGSIHCKRQRRKNVDPSIRNRSGMVLGEGAALFALEELESARSRGAEILGEIIGYGISTDNHHLTQPNPDGSGPRRAMEQALAQARLAPDQVGYINAHGTATILNDSAEGKAIMELFGNVPVSSTKSMMGHSLGAAGAIEAAVTLLALQHQFLPPNINFRESDLSLNVVANEAREAQFDCAVSNSFGFGGTNATIVFRKFAR